MILWWIFLAEFLRNLWAHQWLPNFSLEIVFFLSTVQLVFFLCNIFCGRIHSLFLGWFWKLMSPGHPINTTQREVRLGKPKAAEYLNITLPGLDFASIFCFAWKGVLLVIEQKTNFFERNPSKTQEVQKATLDFCSSLPLVVKVVHFIPPKEMVSSVSGELPWFFEFEQRNLTPLTWFQRWCLFCNLLGGRNDSNWQRDFKCRKRVWKIISSHDQDRYSLI